MATASGTLSAGGIVVPPASGWGDTGVTSTLNADGSVSWCCTTWIVPLPVQAGDVLGTLVVSVRDNGPANGFTASADRNSVTVMVGTPSPDGSTFNALQFATTSANGQTQSVTLTFPNGHIVATGENLQMRVRAQYPVSWPPVAALHPSWVGAATITGGPPPLLAASRTLQVSPFGSNAPVGPWNAGIGSPGLAIPLPMNNGDQIVGLRVRLLDVMGMTLTLSLQSVSDGVVSTVATSPASSGAGSKQTLSVPGLAVSVASGTNYQATISRVSGSGLPSVYWIEVDAL